MKRFYCIHKTCLGILLGLVFGGVSLGVLAGPVGYLQIEGQIEVKSSGDQQAVRVSDNNFTVFSGDQINTRQGAAVLVLNNGGTLGLAPSSRATVRVDRAKRETELELLNGTLLYSLPGHMGRFSVALDDFRLSSDSGGERAIAVDEGSEDDMSGQVERLDDGHVRVSVRTGQMQVQSGGGNRYLVSAGNEIGLLAGSASIEQVSTGDRNPGSFKIESPERVSTGDQFRIRWEMPDPPDEGFITIAPAGSDPEEFESMASIADGQEIDFEAPGSPGDYEIRYIDAETGLVTNFVYLQVIGDRVIVPWYMTRTAIAGMGFAAGLTTAWIICDCDDDDPDPPSP